MEPTTLKNIIEAILLTTDTPLSLKDIQKVFAQEIEPPTKEEIAIILDSLQQEYLEKSFGLQQVASGYRIQIKQEYAPWIKKLSLEKAPRYSRAFLEILAIIAYRQPITRGEIEAIRGVVVNTQIIKALLEREWIYIMGYKPVPGKPAVYATTKQLLDDLNLRSLDELPPLVDAEKLVTLTNYIET